MGDRNKKKNNKTSICKICPEIIGSELAIICNSSEKWSHANCVGLNKQGIDFINESEGAMWFCKNCRPTVKSAIQPGLPKLRIETKKSVDTVKDIISHGISNNGSLAAETLEQVEGIQEACKASETAVTDLKAIFVRFEQKTPTP